MSVALRRAHRRASCCGARAGLDLAILEPAAVHGVPVRAGSRLELGLFGARADPPFEARRDPGCGLSGFRASAPSLNPRPAGFDHGRRRSLQLRRCWGGMGLQLNWSQIKGSAGGTAAATAFIQPTTHAPTSREPPGRRSQLQGWYALFQPPCHPIQMRAVPPEG